MKVTIKQIAEIAEVSRGTVDRVLNDRGKVKPEVEDKIRAVAKMLGYKPNSAAKALSTMKKKMTFGVILPSINNAFFDDCISGMWEAQENLSGLGVELILKEMDGYNVIEYLAAIDTLLEGGITGLILFPIVDDKLTRRINELVEMGIPVVTINSDFENSQRNCYIGIDFKQSGRVAAGIAGLLNRRASVLVLNGSSKLLSHRHRVKGFKEVVTQRFPELRIVDTLECNDNSFTAYDLTIEALKMNEEIDMIYVVGGGIKGVCEAISRYQNREIEVICFDDIPCIKKLMQEGKISATICQQPYKQGYEAIQQMFHIFAGLNNNEELILMESIIKIRENI